MNSRQRIGLAIGGGIIAVAAAVGVGAMAANLSGSSNSGGGQQAGYGQASGGQQGGGAQLDTTTMAKSLATKLGVDEAKVKTALDNAISANQPTAQPSGNASGGAAPSGAAPSGAAPSGNASAGGQGGSGGQNTEMLTAIAKSMASELNLKQATVLAALQEVWTTNGPGGGQQPSAQAS
jgi:hypothetical protein